MYYDSRMARKHCCSLNDTTGILFFLKLWKTLLLDKVRVIEIEINPRAMQIYSIRQHKMDSSKPAPTTVAGSSSYVQRHRPETHVPSQGPQTLSRFQLQWARANVPLARHLIADSEQQQLPNRFTCGCCQWSIAGPQN